MCIVEVAKSLQTNGFILFIPLAVSKGLTASLVVSINDIGQLADGSKPPLLLMITCA